ncbi:GAF domain-containing protein [Mycobacterium sp. MS1601]|uniref:GAF domain-containing protein n=1 Tax=Mycobacterium sp. MS1601 TaxID=1936029 RepID=UPI001F449304|nr:GAF domain-containing protein [Mycobacterium sp. MS1601]
MTASLSGFDDWLNRALEQSALDNGEDVRSYVTRAVAAQMVADHRLKNSSQLQELVARLAALDELAKPPMPSVRAAVCDPRRLQELYATGLLDTPPDEAYDRITRAAAAALDAPFALVTLIDIDRQFFKSAVGMTFESAHDRQTPIERSVCQYAVASGSPLVLEDARTDPVFKNHPAVLDGTFVSYLGVPLISPNGNAVGTLCVFDLKPRLWGSGHIQVISDLANLAVQRMFSAAPSTSR